MSHAQLGVAAAALCALCLALLPLAARGVRWANVGHPEGAVVRDAGWRWSLGRWELMRWGLGAIALVGASLASAPAAPIATATLVIPSLVVRWRAESARDRAARATTRLVQGTHAGVRSGIALPTALRRATDACADGIARAPFAMALDAFRLGAPLEAALREVAATVPDRRARMSLDTVALAVAERLPLERVAALLGSVSDRLAFEEALEAEVRARAGGARTQVRLLAAIVPAMAAYLAVTTPTLGATLGGPLGRTVLIPAALFFEVAGIMLSRRFVRDVLR